VFYTEVIRKVIAKQGRADYLPTIRAHRNHARNNLAMRNGIPLQR